MSLSVSPVARTLRRGFGLQMRALLSTSASDAKRGGPRPIPKCFKSQMQLMLPALQTGLACNLLVDGWTNDRWCLHTSAGIYAKGYAPNEHDDHRMSEAELLEQTQVIQKAFCTSFGVSENDDVYLRSCDDQSQFFTQAWTSSGSLKLNTTSQDIHAMVSPLMICGPGLVLSFMNWETLEQVDMPDLTDPAKARGENVTAWKLPEKIMDDTYESVFLVNEEGFPRLLALRADEDEFGALAQLYARFDTFALQQHGHIDDILQWGAPKSKGTEIKL